jgi:hypothetical protein
MVNADALRYPGDVILFAIIDFLPLLRRQQVHCTLTGDGEEVVTGVLPQDVALTALYGYS